MFLHKFAIVLLRATKLMSLVDSFSMGNEELQRHKLNAIVLDELPHQLAEQDGGRQGIIECCLVPQNDVPGSGSGTFARVMWRVR